MKLGSRLNKILQERNLTVSQLARQSGVSAQTLYAMIKRDSNKADMEIMAKLLKALELDFLEFLGESSGKAAIPAEPSVKAAKPTEDLGKTVEQQAISPEEEGPRGRRQEIEDYLL